MSRRVKVIGGVVRGSAFLFSVCVLLPIVLFEHLAATVAGTSLGPLV